MDPVLLSECVSKLSESNNLNYNLLKDLSKDALTELINASHKALTDPNYIVADNISKETAEELRCVAMNIENQQEVPEPKKNISITFNNFLETKYGRKLDWKKISDSLDGRDMDKVLEERFLELFTSEL